MINNLINIESINRVIGNINKVNYIISEIVDSLEDYVLFEKFGQYEFIADETSIIQGLLPGYSESNCIVIYTSCLCNALHGGEYNHTPWIRSDNLILEVDWFTMSEEQLCKVLYDRNLKRVLKYTCEKKDKIEKELLRIRGAEIMLNSYIRKGLEYEYRNN